MSVQTIILVTLAILIGGNIFGFIYSLLVLKTDIFKKFRIQEKPYQEGVLGKRLPLFLLNLIILAIFSAGGVYMLYEYFDTSWPAWWVIVVQVIFVFLIDDVWFYFAHRWMHENKYILKKIHSIHHRAFTPFPLEYLYVHPFEWMIGIIGTFAGWIIVLTIMPINIYAFWLFALLRNLHEIHIHSDLKIPVLKNIPIISPVEDHDLHHAKLDGNYASTFRIWDRVFKTRFVDQEKSK